MALLKFAVAVQLLLCSKAVASLSNANDELNEDYSFAQFSRDYGKTYETDSEYEQRAKIFRRNLMLILDHNRKRNGNDHFLGVNHLMDLEKHELPLGYIKEFGSAGVSQAQRRLAHPHEMELPFAMEEVSALPVSVNWRGISTPIKDQGRCGSCWAFASISALESHIAIQTGTLYSLSMQELVSCAPNAMNCGGNGGCTGATGQVAYDYVASAGIVQEWQFGYGSYDGAKIECTLYNNATTSETKFLRGPDPPGIKGAVATILGYAETPTNDYKALMNAVAKAGPVAVSVAASNWHLYNGGVFEDHSLTPQATDINHLVVLEGYGTDEETGKDYWIVRNSWGPRWGESGFIRLSRVDPSTLEHPDDDCGEDVTPSDGDACSKDENGNTVIPLSEKVCGTSGIYYNGVIPIGGRLV
jgi:cathepsin L